MSITINGSGDINATGNDIELNSTATTDVTLALGGGSVGVGVASPTATLDVNGTIKLDGNYPVGTGNVALGDTALDSNVSGGSNTAIGADALTANTASNNTAVGYQSGYSNTTATHNTFIGRGSGYSTTTGGDNVALGSSALYTNAGGTSNTSIGYASMYYNTSGQFNVAVGKDALQNNTTASRNTAIGNKSGYSNTTGEYNSFIGESSGYSNTTGVRNTNLGYAAGFSNSTGSYNVAIGMQSLNSNTADRVTAVGYKAGYVSNGTGNVQGTYIGNEAGVAITSGVNNTCVGGSAGSNITTGNYNVIVGVNGGGGAAPLTTGGANVYIGNDTVSGSGTESNAIIIGHGVRGFGSNYITMGTGTGNDRIYNVYTANASWTRVSDERTKKEITDNTDCGLGFIKRLRTVTYKKRAPSEMPEDFAFYDASKTTASYDGKLYGMIAQEVKAAMDAENISDFGGWHQDEVSSAQAISQEMFVVPLIKAVQELSAKVEALESENVAIKARITALENA